MKKQLFTLSIIALALTACGQNVKNNNASAPAGATSAPAAASAAAAGLDSESKQLSYIIGYEIANQMQLSQLKQANIELDKEVLFDAMQDQVNGKPTKISAEDAQKIMMEIGKKVEAAAATAASEANAAGTKFLADNKAKEGVKALPSGLQIKVNKEGTGAQVAKGDLASVEYEGRLTDGTVFDSTKEHDGKPFDVPVVDGTVIPGWIEGLQQMKEGGEYTLYIPANLAYGAQSPTPKIPANSVLVFDMKVTKVQKGEGEKQMAKIRAEQEKMMQEMMKKQGGKGK
ncbi:FKBP-type peptidyl-prolyl cis-trans isomerase [Neisseriaceae bacterium B1]